MMSVYKRQKHLLTFHMYHQIEKLDIQGTDYCLIEPEIATEEINQNEGEREFTARDMAVEAIAMFTSQHKCNKSVSTWN